MPACLRMSVKVTLIGGAGVFLAGVCPASGFEQNAIATRAQIPIKSAQLQRERAQLAGLRMLIACGPQAKAQFAGIAGVRREAEAARSRRRFAVRSPTPARCDLRPVLRSGFL